MLLATVVKDRKIVDEIEYHGRFVVNQPDGTAKVYNWHEPAEYFLRHSRINMELVNRIAERIELGDGRGEIDGYEWHWKK